MSSCSKPKFDGRSRGSISNPCGEMRARPRDIHTQSKDSVVVRGSTSLPSMKKFAADRGGVRIHQPRQLDHHVAVARHVVLPAPARFGSRRAPGRSPRRCPGSPPAPRRCRGRRGARSASPVEWCCRRRAVTRSAPGVPVTVIVSVSPGRRHLPGVGSDSVDARRGRPAGRAGRSSFPARWTRSLISTAVIAGSVARASGSVTCTS